MGCWLVFLFLFFVTLTGCSLNFIPNVQTDLMAFSNMLYNWFERMFHSYFGVFHRWVGGISFLYGLKEEG